MTALRSGSQHHEPGLRFDPPEQPNSTFLPALRARQLVLPLSSTQSQAPPDGGSRQVETGSNSPRLIVPKKVAIASIIVLFLELLLASWVAGGVLGALTFFLGYAWFTACVMALQGDFTFASVRKPPTASNNS